MKKPKRFSPIYVYAAKIEKKGQDFGKATISNLVLVPNAIGFIDFEKPATPIIVVDNSNNNEGLVVTRKKFLEKMNSWGPAFEITFEIKVKKFTGQVLYLTDGTRRGDGIPEIFALNNRLEIKTRVKSHNLKLFTQRLEINIWYHISISQKLAIRSRKKVFHELFYHLNIYIYSVLVRSQS